MHYYSIQLYNKLEEETGQVCYRLKGMPEHYLVDFTFLIQCSIFKVTLTVISVVSFKITTVINTYYNYYYNNVNSTRNKDYAPLSGIKQAK